MVRSGEHPGYDMAYIYILLLCKDKYEQIPMIMTQIVVITY